MGWKLSGGRNLALHGFSDLRVCYHPDDFYLVGDLLQHASHLRIAVHEPELGVLQPTLLRELLHDQARLAEVVPGQTREEVVRYLQVQPAMDKLDALRANHIDSRAELAREERLNWA